MFLKFIILISLFGWLSLSQAAEWSLKGWLDQSLGYDDNVFMNPDGSSGNQQGKQGSFQYKITPVLSFLHKTDVTEVEGSASYGTQVYTDIEGLDQDVQRYSLRGLYKTELIDWGLKGNYSVIPTRNTAILDSGVFSSNSQNTTWALAPTIAFKIDELDSLVLSSSYSESTFSSSTSFTNQNFSNNTNANVDISWQRMWSERYTSGLHWFYNTVDYQPQGSNVIPNNFSSNFDSTGLNFSNSYLWSESWNLDGTVGFRHTNSESSNGAVSSSFGFLADVGIGYKGENFGGGINFSRALVPSNLGQLQEQTSIGLNFNYQITERLSAGFSTSYQESTLVDGNNSQTRDNLVINPSVSWQLAPEWSLTGSYRYRSQTGFPLNTGGTNFIDRTADSNLFLLSINYNWQGLKMSR